MDSMLSIMKGIFNPLENPDKIGRAEVGDYTVDTCDTSDAGYETAIWKGNNNMVIVERYANNDAAADGHSKWVEFCKSNPVEVWSVQCDENIKF